MNSATPSHPDDWQQSRRDLVIAGQEAAASEQVQAAYAADPALLDDCAPMAIR